MESIEKIKKIAGYIFVVLMFIGAPLMYIASINAPEFGAENVQKLAEWEIFLLGVHTIGAFIIWRVFFIKSQKKGAIIYLAFFTAIAAFITYLLTV